MNISKISLSLFSIALLLILPRCAQTEQEHEEGYSEFMEMIDTTLSDAHDTDEDNTEITRRYQTAGMIKLFIYPSCPYCQRVMATLRDSGNMSKVLVLDASIPKYLVELKRLTNGNTQCPFIFDEEKNIKMHESKDIIKYFQKRFTE